MLTSPVLRAHYHKYSVLTSHVLLLSMTGTPCPSSQILRSPSHSHRFTENLSYYPYVLCAPIPASQVLYPYVLCAPSIPSTLFPVSQALHYPPPQPDPPCSHPSNYSVLTPSLIFHDYTLPGTSCSHPPRYSQILSHTRPGYVTSRSSGSWR